MLILLYLYNMRRYLPLLIIVFLASCQECTRYAKNYVADRETRKPIIGAQVFCVAATNGKQELEKNYYTDSIGSFEAMFTKGGVTQCPVMKMTISKDGYYPSRFWDPALGDTLFLDRVTN